MCQSNDKVSTTAEQSSFPIDRTIGGRSRKPSAALYIIVSVLIGTSPTKMGSITPEQGHFLTARTMRGRSRLQ